MPEGQLTNLILDPNTGGIITPGVLVNDDFRTNKLANYIDYINVGSKSYLTVDPDENLYNNTVNTARIRNNRSFFYGNSLISLRPGNVPNWNMVLYAKILDDNNSIFMGGSNTTNSIIVYQVVNGVSSRLDAGDITVPVPSDFSEWWWVTRVAKFKSQTRLTVQTYQSPPYMFFPPYQVRDYFLDIKFGNNKGYAGIMIASNSATFPTGASIGEWMVTDDTIKTIF